MIVDDDIQATTLLEKILSVEGYEPITVNESWKAVQVARSANPDLFLLDLMMPDPDGFKLCRLLRAEKKFAHTPVIILTALSDTDSRAVAYGAGATDYLTKPYHPNELKSIIKGLVNKS